MNGNRKSMTPKTKITPLKKLIRKFQVPILAPKVTQEVNSDGTVLFKKYGSTLAMSNVRFPQKLWNIVHSCKTGAIGWTYDGDNIFINYNLFKNEYLVNREGINDVKSPSSPNEDDFADETMTCCQSEASSASQVSQNVSKTNQNVFKTSQITSFIRQLNLYGFRKVATVCGQDDMLNCEYLDYCDALTLIRGYNESKPEIQIFSNPCFVRGRHDLIEKIVRCPSDLRSKQQPSTSKKPKKSDFFTRRPIKRKRHVCTKREEDDESWLEEELAGEIPDVDDDFIELLLSDNVRDIESDDGQCSGDGQRKKSSPEVWRGKKSVRGPTLNSSKNSTPPKPPQTVSEAPKVRTPFDLLTVDDCIRLLDSTATESWTSFYGEGMTKARVRQLPLYQILDSDIPPIASVMLTSSDPFLSSSLFTELH